MAVTRKVSTKRRVDSEGRSGFGSRTPSTKRKAVGRTVAQSRRRQRIQRAKIAATKTKRSTAKTKSRVVKKTAVQRVKSSRGARRSATASARNKGQRGAVKRKTAVKRPKINTYKGTRKVTKSKADAKRQYKARAKAHYGSSSSTKRTASTKKKMR